MTFGRELHYVRTLPLRSPYRYLRSGVCSIADALRAACQRACCRPGRPQGQQTFPPVAVTWTSFLPSHFWDFPGALTPSMPPQQDCWAGHPSPAPHCTAPCDPHICHPHRIVFCAGVTSRASPHFRDLKLPVRGAASSSRGTPPSCAGGHQVVTSAIAKMARSLTTALRPVGSSPITRADINGSSRRSQHAFNARLHATAQLL